MRDDLRRFVKRELTREDLDYILSLRRRVRKWGWGMWIVIIVFSILYWESIGLGGFLLVVLSAAVVGAAISFFVSRSVERRTGLGTNEQIYVWRRYQSHGYDFFDNKTKDELKEEVGDDSHVDKYEENNELSKGNSDATEWFYSDGEEKYGPVPRDSIEEMMELEEGESGLLVWKEGMDDWKTASEVFDFTAEPPPLPSDRSEKSTSSSSSSQQAKVEGSSDRSIRWTTFWKVYVPTLAVAAFFATDGYCFFVKSCALGRVWSSPIKLPKLLGEILGVSFAISIAALIVGLFFWTLGYVNSIIVKERKPSYIKSVLYANILLSLLIIIGSIYNSNINIGDSGYLQPSNNSGTGGPSPTKAEREKHADSEGEAMSGGETARMRTDKNDGGEKQTEKETSKSIDIDLSRDTVEIDLDEIREVGKPGGRIQVQYTAEFSSKPNAEGEVIEWIPEDTWLKNAQKQGDYYKVDHEGRTGYIHRLAVKPDHRF